MAVISSTAEKYAYFIAGRFDDICYSDVVKNTAPSGKVAEIYKEPPAAQVLNYNAADTISNWIFRTGFLDAPLTDSTQEERKRLAIEWSAEDRLRALGQRLGYGNPPSTQLLNYIFHRVIIEADPEKMKMISEEIEPFQALVETPSLENKRQQYWAGTAVSFALTPLLSAFVSYYVYPICKRLQPQVISYLKRLEFPRRVFLAIQHAPITVIHLSSRVNSIFQYASKHPWIVGGGIFIAWGLAARIHPYLATGIDITGKIIFYKDTIANFIGVFFANRFLRIFWATFNVSPLFGKSWAETKQRGIYKLEPIVEEGELKGVYVGYHEAIKAYQVWISVMQGDEAFRSVKSNSEIESQSQSLSEDGSDDLGIKSLFDNEYSHLEIKTSTKDVSSGLEVEPAPNDETLD